MDRYYFFINEYNVECLCMEVLTRRKPIGLMD